MRSLKSVKCGEVYKPVLYPALQYGCQHVAGTSFTIGAGYMDTFKFCVGIIKEAANFNRIMEVFFISNCPNATEHRQLCI